MNIYQKQLIAMVIWFIWGVSFIIRSWARGSKDRKWYPMKEIGLYLIYTLAVIIGMVMTQ